MRDKTGSKTSVCQPRTTPSLSAPLFCFKSVLLLHTICPARTMTRPQWILSISIFGSNPITFTPNFFIQHNCKVCERFQNRLPIIIHPLGNPANLNSSPTVHIHPTPFFTKHVWGFIFRALPSLGQSQMDVAPWCYKGSLKFFPADFGILSQIGGVRVWPNHNFFRRLKLG